MTLPVREIDRGNYEAAQAELALSVSLDPITASTREGVRVFGMEFTGTMRASF